MRTEDRATIRTAAVPWYIWCCVLACTSGSIGGLWDISWHKSIGRDSFWTPAHIAIYLCGVLAGLACAYLIFSTTFSRSSAAREASVRVWGFHGPLGAFMCAWGGLAMITSAPFDNWWHSAYGLDVRILSPPHVLLIFGLTAIRVGTLILILGQMNRAAGKLRARLHALLLYTFMFLFGLSIGVFQELILRNHMHSARFYLLISIGAPLCLAAVSRISEQRWACTIMVGIYTAFYLALMWILPLFPAEPKLGPVYQKVTHFLPPDFPLLLIVPAAALDLLRPKLAAVKRWGRSAAMGAVFLATFVAVQWPFAGFLMSPAARNWFFGTQNLPFWVPSTTDWARDVFTHVEQTASEFWFRMGMALATATLSARAGLAWGEWMRRVRR